VILTFLTSVISFLAVIGPVLLIHELAHFLVGKFLGAKPEVFSIGFGKPIYSFRFLDSDFKIGLIPLGGYVAFEKLQFEYEREVSGRPDLSPLSPWRWVLIAAAGPAANFLLAALVGMTIVYRDLATVTRYELSGNGNVYELKDTTQSFLLTKICSNACPKAIQHYNGSYRALSEPRVAALVGGNIGGRLSSGEKLFYSAVISLQAFRFLSLSTIDGLKDIATTKNGFRSLSGPVGIASLSNQAARDGFLSYLGMVGMISFSVGFFNLLPLSILDGGRVFLGLVEMTLRKPIAKSYAMPFQLLSLGLIGLLFIASFLSDFAQLLGL
jgi:regulator of sigma E protease